MSAAAIEQLITQCVADALLDYETNRKNGNRNNNGNRSHDLGCGSGRTLHTACWCTYKEFLNCQPLNFKGTEGAVGLAHWFEKMKSVFRITSCAVECQVKYATCTLLGGALTWWKSHVRTVGHDAAYGTSWKSLMKMMTEAYCLRNEIQKLKNELSLAATTNQRALVANQITLTCFECEKQGHYRSECLKLKNRNPGNQAGSSEARGRVYALGRRETDQDPNNIADNVDA
ncbi:reverse transcriptase domain-containing protein [Tanacetum coccineum]